MNRNIPSRPRNRNPRPPRTNNPRHHQSHKPSSSSVPTTQHVQRGAHVWIVQKQDQPTGREVTGTVQDVLTRGDHPRGIKVRLGDGRIGRVQRMGDGSGSGGESGGVVVRERGVARRDGDGGGGAEELPIGNLSLAAFLPPEPRGPDDAGSDGSSEGDGDFSIPSVEQEEPTYVTATCPVCGTFTGDEQAVAWHVQGHFEGD